MKATPWKELKDRKISKERQAEIAKAVEQELLEMTLADLRREAGLTQVELSESSEITQAELSRIERRDDHLLSTLRRYVVGLGGELEVVAVLGNKRITLQGV
jgi:predicted transcriptional regulator